MAIENFSSKVSDERDKTQLLFALFLKQVYIYSLLKNYITSIQVYIEKTKEVLDQISKEWPENKSFLEAAYKILVLKQDLR